MSVPVTCWVIPMLKTIEALSALPKRRAASLSFSAGTPVISSTSPGLYLSTVPLKPSKPSHLFLMNSSSCSPSSMITFIRPFSRATSVPPLCLSQTVAYSTRSIFRGSATINLAPLSATACFKYLAMTGWFSVVFDPVTKITSAPRSSEMELVIAPEPNAFTRPATVGAWQRRAQWSTLLVLKHARTNFWKT